MVTIMLARPTGREIYIPPPPSNDPLASRYHWPLTATYGGKNIAAATLNTANMIKAVPSNNDPLYDNITGLLVTISRSHVHTHELTAISNNKLTISMWIRCTGLSSYILWLRFFDDSREAINWNQGSTNMCSMVMISGDCMCATYYGTFDFECPGLPKSNTTLFPMNTPIHLCFTFDPLYVYAYHNGVYKGKAKNQVPNQIVSYKTLILGNTSGSDAYIRNVRLYNKELTAAQILQLYQKGIAF